MKMTGWQRFWLFATVLLFVNIATGVVVSLNSGSGDIYEVASGSGEESSGALAAFDFAVMQIFLVLPFLALVAFVPRTRFAERAGSARSVRSIAVIFLNLLVQMWIAWVYTEFLFYWFVHDHYLISVSYLVALLVFAAFFWIDVKRALPNSVRLWLAAYMIVLVVFSAHFGLHGPRLNRLQMTHEEIASRGLVGSTHAMPLSIAVGTDGAIYAGTDRGGYRSTDKGVSWAYITKGLKKEEEDIFALVHDRNQSYVRTRQGIFESVDKGQHWRKISGGLATGDYDDFTSSLAVAADGMVYAGTGDGIFKSADKGTHWAGASITKVLAEFITVAPDGVIYALTNRRIFKSTDKGVSWTETSDQKVPANYMVVAPDGTMYAGNYLYIFKSMDNGIHWTDGVGWFSHSHIRSVAVAPDGMIYVATDMGFCESADNGASWRPLGDILTRELQCQ